MSIVTTGFFDGVHLGHRLVLERLLSLARDRGEEAVVVTFWPHPRTVLQQDARELRLLSSIDEKRSLLVSCGVSKVEVVPFTREFASLTAKEYLDMLREKYGASAIVMGYDNVIGCDRKSGAELDSGEVYLVGATGLYGGTVPISSTKIRAFLSEGNIAAASSMLGYDYGLYGVVVAGNRIGRTLGFPTANMQLYEPLKLVPGNGVYAVRVHVLGKVFRGMCNIGNRPTVGGGARTIETHILDFDEYIYGLPIRVEFLGRLRDECHFSSLEDLRSQLSRDAAMAREWAHGVGGAGCF